jgi:hypothetical protein
MKSFDLEALITQESLGRGRGRCGNIGFLIMQCKYWMGRGGYCCEREGRALMQFFAHADLCDIILSYNLLIKLKNPRIGDTFQNS